MLTKAELLTLFEDLQDKDVLSVYVNAEEHDPANRDAWRVRLTGEIGRLRRRLAEENGDGADAFEASWSLVEGHLRARVDGLPGARGWVAFATSEELWHADGVPASMPDLVRWQRGIHVAPYIRALKQERPVTVVLVDARRARVFHQAEGAITEHEGLLADTYVGDLTDVGMRKSSARASGMRGETSTDQAQRLLEVAGERMRKEVAALVVERAGNDGIVVVGGPTESVKKLAALLPRSLDGRVAERPRLHLDMSAAELREEIRGAAGDLSEAGHRALVREVADAARAGGKGALGKDDTLKALHAHQVETLLVSRSFLHDHPAVADLAVGLAFSQGGDAVEVSGEAGELLDREADGVGARLRFLRAEPTTA